MAERKPREVEKITHVTKGENGEDLYCLKWQEFSYRDVTYAAEEEAMELCKPKVMALKKKEARGEDVRTPFPEQYTRVDRILAKRWNDKYLVQWQALPPSEATWEDENSLEGDEEARAIQRYYDCEELRTLSVNDWDPKCVHIGLSFCLSSEAILTHFLPKMLVLAAMSDRRHSRTSFSFAIIR